MKPKKVYFPAYFSGKENYKLNRASKHDLEYVSKKYLLDALTRERLTIRHHLKDEDWREDWRRLKEYEETLTEFIYRLRKV